ncbi:MAG TPA: ATP-binding protein [Blastocatellia bacterium]|jgi:nitrogen fixation/metabolism regulation signal transduction histidine kinase|nr:ATP-binding protein [Blastocatellia bacterium]
MSLRLKLTLYLVAVHLLFAGVAVYLLLQNRVWLLAVEALFAISLAVGFHLMKNLFGTIELINTGAQFITDGDFTARFREVGQQELDQLVHIYNRMIDHLRDERLKLQEQNYFLDKILKASPSGIITLDFDQRIEMVNPCAETLLQAGAGDLVGKTLAELNGPLAQELDGLGVNESRVLAFLGRRRVKCQRSQFYDRGFLRDFILMEEMTEELRQSEKAAYEKLIRLMSHEVNNSVGASNSLLHSCLTYTSQLRQDDREDFETALRVVISRTDQLNRFMRSFADVVRLPPPKLIACDVYGLLNDMAFLLREESTRRDIAWRWDVQEPPGYVAMDRGQMEQVMVNVIKNAMEAIGEKGSITVRTGKLSGRKFVCVEDTGSGIAPEARASLFTPFFSTKENGQGIGLTMVQEILDNHGFDFSLASEPGEPTRFTIYF